MFDEVTCRQGSQRGIETGKTNPADATLLKVSDPISQGRNSGRHHFAALSRKPLPGGGLKRQHRGFQIAYPSRLAKSGKQRLMPQMNAIKGTDRDRARLGNRTVWTRVGFGSAEHPL